MSSIHNKISIYHSAGSIIFDSDKMFHDPRPKFSKMDILDFEIYVATIYSIASASTWESEKLDFEYNRIDKSVHFIIKAIKDHFSSRNYFIENNNDTNVEYMVTYANKWFDLISMTIDRYYEEKTLHNYGCRILNWTKNGHLKFPYVARRTIAKMMFEKRGLSKVTYMRYISADPELLDYAPCSKNETYSCPIT